MPSFYNPGGTISADARMTEYSAVITREYPHWIATVTGGDLPESGHVITSLSYGRMCDEIQDWLEWHGGYNDPLHEDEPDDNDDGDDGSGEGFSVRYDLRFPQPVIQAHERYWEARKAQAQVREDLRQSVSEMFWGLRASDDDVARMLCMSAKRVRLIVTERL